MPAQTEVTDAPSLTAMFHGTAAYVDRILKGAKPSQIIVHENQTNAFAIVDLKSGDVVVGESMARPRSLLAISRQGEKMGGVGSGFYLRFSGAPKCEDYPCIDLARLRRSGMLRPGARGLITFGKEKPDRILVFTKTDGTGLTFIKRRPDGALGKLFVSFTYTPTAFNGWRVWFCCPGCKRRCRCLYGANTLRCRKCLGLVYASQSERTYWRAQRRADSIRRRLDSKANDMDPQFPDKPKRMRWRTLLGPKAQVRGAALAFPSGRGRVDQSAIAPP